MRLCEPRHSHLRTLTIAGDAGNIETLRTTDDHPFYVDGRGRVNARDLVAGDFVQESDGTWQSVISSTRDAFPNGITVYNLMVEGDQTYFVEDGFGSADPIWVHNTYSHRVTPKGVIGGKPSGHKTHIDPNRRPEQKQQIVRENESADVIAAKGYVVEQNPPPKPNGKEPDYKIEGEYYDCYAPTSTSPNSIRTNLLKEKIRKKQVDRVVVNLDDTSVTPQQIESVLAEYPIHELKDIMYIKGGQIVVPD